MAEDYIWTENMTVGYGKTPLIRQIGIHVRAGEIVTLIGPNGAGKSTILRSVIRQLGLLEGTVYLDGMPMKGMGGEGDCKEDVHSDDRADSPGAYDL